jgi:hypothetical protein
MRRTIYKQIKFIQVTPNAPFYLVHPDSVQLPAVPAVHYPCETFQPDTPIWVVSDEIDYVKTSDWCTVLI